MMIELNVVWIQSGPEKHARVRPRLLFSSFPNDKITQRFSGNFDPCISTQYFCKYYQHIGYKDCIPPDWIKVVPQI